MTRLSASLALAGLVLSWCRPVEAAQGDDRALLKIYVCSAEAAPMTLWRYTLSRAIAHATSSTRHDFTRVMGEAQCGDHAVEFACTAGVYDQAGRVLVCSPDTLLRLLRVAAWYAVQHAERPGEDYEAFRNRNPARLGFAAFSASAQGQAGAALEAAIERLRAGAESAGGMPQDRQGQVFRAILNMELAAMFGHEASHLEEKPPYCAVGDRSRLEESGLWAVLLRVSASDELYRRGTPYQGEVAADRCAGRRVRAERAALAAGPLGPDEQDFVRRAAADIVSTMLVSHDAGSDRRPIFRVNDAYLPPPLRILALAGEIGAGAHGPIVCGGAAENLVEAAQQTFKAIPGDGIMPDEMEHAFPTGVIDAWNHRADWSPSVFSCR